MKTIKNVCSAFQFMTVLPVPVRTGMENLERSMVYYPLTGAVIGLLTGYGYFFSRQALPPTVAAILTVIFYLILTRGLHIDGLMDTLDGFFCHRDRESVLRIMKDPVAGSFAVLGAIAWFFLLVSLIPLLNVADMIMIPATGRAAILIMPLVFSYPRESGTGKFFVENVKIRTVAGAICLTLATGAAVWFSGIPRGTWITGPLIFVALYGGALILASTVALAAGAWAGKKIGGITGDILGFTIESVHLLLALGLAMTAKLKVM